MKPVTLYTVQAEQVVLADGFTLSRQSTQGLRHSLGDGYVLVGVPQQHMHAIQGCQAPDGQGAYIAIAPELRELLELPMRAELEAARRQVAMLAREVERLTAAPWPLRVIRALMRRERAGCGPAFGGHQAAQLQ